MNFDLMLLQAAALDATDEPRRIDRVYEPARGCCQALRHTLS
jgi:hypothetical protein